MTIKSCPSCGETMVLSHSYLGTVHDFWFCISCWHAEIIPKEYTIWYTDNTDKELDYSAKYGKILYGGEGI